MIFCICLALSVLCISACALLTSRPTSASPARIGAPGTSPAATTATIEYKRVLDVLYREEGDVAPYMRERCRLDVYYPSGVKDFASIVWFHGGGLTGGEREFPEHLHKQGIAVISADYRLSPKAKAPVYIEDAAAAVAWTFRHIEKYGGSRNRIFVGGHSAGGYLAAMVGLDKRWLAAQDIDANRIAGLAPFSGQAITHFEIRAERGIDVHQPVIDELAPIYHVRKDAPPMLLVTGDRELEMLGRYEENAYFWRMMKLTGNSGTELYELHGFDHAQMAEPACPLLIRFIERVQKNADQASAKVSNSS